MNYILSAIIRGSIPYYEPAFRHYEVSATG